jgi:hypothetical protein
MQRRSFLTHIGASAAPAFFGNRKAKVVQRHK